MQNGLYFCTVLNQTASAPTFNFYKKISNKKPAHQTVCRSNGHHPQNMKETVFQVNSFSKKNGLALKKNNDGQAMKFIVTALKRAGFNDLIIGIFPNPAGNNLSQTLTFFGLGGRKYFYAIILHDSLR